MLYILNIIDILVLSEKDSYFAKGVSLGKSLQILDRASLGMTLVLLCLNYPLKQHISPLKEINKRVSSFSDFVFVSGPTNAAERCFVLFA